MHKGQIPLLVLITVPDHDTGKRIAEALIEERLAACVNILPGMESIYRWEGKVQVDLEAQLLIKTRQALLEDRLIPRIKDLHPYDLPEIIALPLEHGSNAYLDWIVTETGG